MNVERLSAVEVIGLQAMALGQDIGPRRLAAQVAPPSQNTDCDHAGGDPSTTALLLDRGFRHCQQSRY